MAQKWRMGRELLPNLNDLGHLGPYLFNVCIGQMEWQLKMLSKIIKEKRVYFFFIFVVTTILSDHSI